MANQYGPWATMIDIGGRPQLSAFWRRRVTMLVPASRTSPVLSRHNLLWLGAAAVLMLALPTFRFAAAAEDVASHTGEGAMSYSGFIVGADGSQPVSTYLHLPVYIYCQLGYATTRSELKFTPDQEKKLVDLSRDSMKREEEARKRIQQELEKLSPADRIAQHDKFQARLAELSTSDAVRKQIEALLTKDQLTKLRAVSIESYGLGRLMHDKNLREKVGISQRQTKQVERLVWEEEQRQAAQLSKLAVAIEQKMLAVVTPEQWAKLERDVAANGGAVPDNAFSFNEFGVLLSEDLRKPLGLTAKQQETVRELFKESQERFGSNLMGWNLDRTDANHQAEMARRSAELAKKAHKEIDRILTKEQAATLASIALRQTFLSSLNTALFPGTPAVEWRGGLLRQIKLSPVQWKELCRLHDEKERINWQHAREVGEDVLKILSPEQQDKCFEEWSRNFMS
jgi:hypothetical protein